MFNVTLSGDRQLIEQLAAMPASVQTVLRVKATKLALQLRGYIRDDKLSGQVLAIRSGDLKASIEQTVVADATSVTAEVFSSGDVKYAAIHEFGGTIAAHDIVPDKADALAFMYGGKQIFAKIVHIPDVNMPERSFMRSALADMADDIITGLKDAVIQGASQALGKAA
jgi:phage gpG-like protein